MRTANQLLLRLKASSTDLSQGQSLRDETRPNNGGYDVWL